MKYDEGIYRSCCPRKQSHMDIQKLTCWAHALIASLLEYANNDNLHIQKSQDNVKNDFSWIYEHLVVVTIHHPLSLFITNPRAHLSPHRYAADLAQDYRTSPPTSKTQFNCACLPPSLNTTSQDPKKKNA